MRYKFTNFLLLSILFPFALFAQQQKAPLYWTAYEYCFLASGNGMNGGAMPESVWKANIDWVAENLLPYGYNIICIDGWGDDWSVNEHGYRDRHAYGGDQSGSVKWEHDYAYWADYCQQKGLTLGIYNNPLWVNIGFAGDKNIKGTDIKINTLVDENRPTTWFNWVEVDRPGAEEYVKGYIQYYADMGVKFLRVDFLSWFEDGKDKLDDLTNINNRPEEHYQTALKWMKEACDANGMILSLVMPHLYEDAKNEIAFASGSMIRVNEDAYTGGWDRLSDLSRGTHHGIWSQWWNMFDGMVYWSKVSDQMILDGDFTMLNTFDSADEKKTMISIQLMAGGPIAVADQHNTIKSGDLQYYTNADMLMLNADGFVGKPLSNDPTNPQSQIWKGQMSNGDWIVGLFNRENTAQTRSIDFAADLGLDANKQYDVFELWDKTNSVKSGQISESIPSHGCRIYKIQKEPIKEQLIMVGEGLPGGWSIDDGYVMQQSSSDMNVFTYTGYIEAVETGGFKFLTTTAFGNKEYRRNGAPEILTSSNTGTLIARTGDSNDDLFRVDVSGNYLITCNLNTLAVTIEPKEIPSYDALYLIGDGTDAGWEMSKAIVLSKKGDTHYEGVCRLFPHSVANEGFKLCVTNDEEWMNSDFYVSNVGNQTTLTPGTSSGIEKQGTNDNKWIVNQEGVYTVTVDLAANTILLKDYTEDELSGLHRPSALYLIGNATPAIWEAENAIELDKTENIFTCIVELDASKDGDEFRNFKFLVQPTWGSLEYRCLDNLAYDETSGKFKGKLTARAGEPDIKFTPPYSGVYKLTCNMDEMTLTAEIIKPTTNLYLIGGAASSIGWKLEDAVQLVQDKANCFQYVSIDPISFNTNGDFKILSEIENDAYGHPAFFRRGNDIPLAVGIEGQMTTDRTDDRKWKIAATGNYYVTVDLEKMTIVLRNELPTGTFTWSGEKDNNWADPENWVKALDYPKDKNYNVFIPNISSRQYPVIASSDDNAACDTITFAHGAELGSQDLLDYNRAVVQLNLTKERWHMLSMPIQTTVDNFNLRKDDETAPKTWYRKFTPTGNQAKWTYITKTNEQVIIGDGFSFWIESTAEATTKFTVEGQLAGSTPINTPISFGQDGSATPFAYVGNPYMTTINFDELLKESNNSIIISPNYVIHDGTYFVGYSEDGTWGPNADSEKSQTSNERTIAPLQAFIVEAASGISGEQTLRFSNIAGIQATGEGSGLKKAVSVAKLNIVADNGTIPVTTFISDRENAQSARKLKSGMSDLPDVYTLSQDKSVALGAQVINTYDITIPLAVATTKEGSMSLSFSGMQDFADAKIELVDMEEKKRIKLEGNEYVHNFEFTPSKNTEGDIIPCENRFSIVFSPTNVTGTEEMIDSNLSVYLKNNILNLISSFDNSVCQIHIYDMQGRVVHSETNLQTTVHSIDLSDKPANVYAVKIITEKGVKSMKVVNR